MTELEKGAIARLTAAVKDKPVGVLSYSEVLAVDVVTVSALIEDGKHTAMSRAIRDGAVEAARRYPDKADLEVFQTTEHLRHLLELVPVAPVE